MKKTLMVITIVFAGSSLVFGQEQSVAAIAEMYKTCAKHSIATDRCNAKMYSQLKAQEQGQAPVEVKTTEVQEPVVNVQDAAALEEQYRTCANHFIPADKCTAEIYRQLKEKEKAPLDPNTARVLPVVKDGQNGLTGPGILAPVSTLGKNLTWVRKLYITGSKERAVKSAPKDVDWHTCLEVADNVKDADAVMVLSQSSYRMPPPDRRPSGILSCHSTTSGASCMDTGSGMETTVTCSRNGSFCDVSTGYNMGAAMLDLAGGVTRALVERAMSVAVLVDKSNNNVLWQWDEGYDIYTDKVKGGGFYSGMWWAELNIAVGCGKPTINPHKHWKPGQWPEPTPQPQAANN